jgi:hypothetical protein
MVLRPLTKLNKIFFKDFILKDIYVMIDYIKKNFFLNVIYLIQITIENIIEMNVKYLKIKKKTIKILLNKIDNLDKKNI